MDRSLLVNDFEATDPYPAVDLPCGCNTAAPKRLECMRCPALNLWLTQQGGPAEQRYVPSNKADLQACSRLQLGLI